MCCPIEIFEPLALYVGKLRIENTQYNKTNHFHGPLFFAENKFVTMLDCDGLFYIYSIIRWFYYALGNVTEISVILLGSREIWRILA